MSNTTPRIKFETIGQAAVEAASRPQSHQCTIAAARNEIFRLGSIVGRLCSEFLTVPYDCSDAACTVGEGVKLVLGEVFLQLFRLAKICGIDLRLSVLKKMELNGRKYPVELCKGKSGKYTKYSNQTGITKTEGQSTVDRDVNNISFESTISEDPETDNTEEVDTATIEGVTLLLRKFSSDRLWNRYHTPRNIALALIGEVGELAELFQWSGDVSCESMTEEELSNQSDGLMGIGWSAEEVDKVGQEIADVSIYLIRLADVCGVSLGASALTLLG